MLESRYIDDAIADVRRGMYERIGFLVLSWTIFPMLKEVMHGNLDQLKDLNSYNILQNI